MKTKVLIAVFLIGSTLGLKAQDNAKSIAMEQAKEKTAQLDQFLELTPEQEAEITRINQAYFDKRHKVNDGQMEMQERKERIKRELAQYKYDIKEVLTPEQQEKFESKADELTHNMGEKMQERREQRRDQMELKDAEKREKHMKDGEKM